MRLEAISVLLGIHLVGFAGWTGLLAAFLLAEGPALRLLRWCLLAMPVALVSGWGLALASFGGPADWSWAINGMQTAGLAMAVVLLIAWFGGVLLVRDAERVRDHDAIDVATRRLRRLVAADLMLGGVALVLAVLGRVG